MGPSGRFANCTAVVTGGCGAIGAAIGTALRAAGARVAALDLVAPDGATGEETEPDGSGDVPGPADLVLTCDVTDEAATAAALSQVRSVLGQPDLLVCAAGVVSEAEIGALSGAEWRRVVDVSLTGTFHALSGVLPGMAAAGRGSVVAISSGWASKGYPRGGHYAAAKAGVEALVKSAALEVAGRGVRVNAVAPGPVLTPFLRHVPDLHAWRREREAVIPMGRIGDPSDVVGPVLFLLGQESAYVTGQVLHVNGGLLMP